MAQQKRFISAYQGSATYNIDGKLYEVRTFAFHQHPFRAEIFSTEILPMVGCVWSRDDHGSFPSADVMAQFPGYTAARYLPDPRADHMGASRVDYATDAPSVTYSPTLDATEIIL